jgi:hypothetical protein
VDIGRLCGGAGTESIHGVTGRTRAASAEQTTDEGDAMSALLERPDTTLPPEPTVHSPAPAPRPPARLPIDRVDLTGNPVAAAHERWPKRSDRPVETGRYGQILLWLVLIPTLLFLVSNPVGWLLLLFGCLAAGALTGVGGIL